MPVLLRSPSTALVIAAALCLAAAAVGSLTIVAIGAIRVPALWPAAGVLAAVLILSDRRGWPVLIAASFGALLVSSAVLLDQPMPAGVTTASVTAINALLAASFVRRVIDGPFALNRLAHVSALVISAAVVPIAGAALGAAALFLGGAAPFATAWRALFLAESLGMLVAAPVVIALFSSPSRLAATIRSWKGLEIALAFSGTVVVAAGIFGEGLTPLVRVPAWILPFLFWGVFRLGPGGTAAIILVISVIGLWNAGQGLGPFALAGATSTGLVLRSQGAIGIAAASFVLLASIVAERTRIAQEHAALVAELQQALAEIKTLQGLIPICAWCHKVRDDAGFWQQIEEYLNHRTDATFSHGICPGCTRIAETELRSHEGSDVVHF